MNLCSSTKDRYKWNIFVIVGDNIQTTTYSMQSVVDNIEDILYEYKINKAKVIKIKAIDHDLVEIPLTLDSQLIHYINHNINIHVGQ